jgi:hypothetical protein
VRRRPACCPDGRTGSRQLRKVHFQHIGFDDGEVTAQAQPSRQVTVEFDHCQVAQPLHQGLGQCTQARADLDNRFSRMRRNGVHDGTDDAAVIQEVLAEPLARGVGAGAHAALALAVWAAGSR